MYARPEFISIVAGLLFTGLLYTYGRTQQPPPPASTDTHRSFSSKELVMAFVAVTFLVYGSFQYAFYAGSCQPIKHNILLQTGAQAPF